ncbi:MAG: AAA family ATPase [Candidatus Competibacteraceae bacterium]|nr:AAA family ATPase [Candidatus Competibacteraceae bacterium]
MNEQRGDAYLNLYNPATLGAEQLLREFIDRKGLLERILDIVRQNTPDKPQQHLIIIGPRGMGKTMLLCAIRHRVNGDVALNAEWLPISFYEEQYGIGDLADFWLEAIRHLESALNRPSQTADELLDHPGDDLAERAEARFFELLAESGKRALLFVDNLNDIFAAIHAEEALHQLRALLMEDPRLMLVGTAASYFAEITDVSQPFHDFFRTFSLERLDQEELETVFRTLADANNDPTVPQILEKAPERVQALRILTGGNPRLAKLGYRILREGLDGDVRRDLERLLDECTPFFKHRIEGLAKEGRRIFDAIARRWDPVTVDDLKKELRKPSNYISAQIKRLVDEGFVEEASGTEKKKRYQVAERFYNIYYLMRYSREGRKKLRWLVVFMKVFYTSRDYRDWAERLERELTSALSPDAIKEKLAHLDTLMAAADGPYAQSEDSKDVLAALLALDESQQPLFEPLILALRAFRDRSVLYQIAREKRDLVLDVMARISGTTNSPAS